MNVLRIVIVNSEETMNEFNCDNKIECGCKKCELKFIGILTTTAVLFICFVVYVQFFYS